MLKNTSITTVKFIICIFTMLPLISVAAPVSYNIIDYGAKGDGVTLNTKSIQSAIDACSKGGGGTVFFPAGNYLTGTLFLKSYVTLSIQAGAVLAGSKDLDDYPATLSKIRSYTDNYTNKSLIYGEDLEYIAITGMGFIDGNGGSFGSEDLAKKDLFASYKIRPFLIRFVNCKNILVRDVTMLNSPMWVQHYLACESINIDGITVKSRVNHNNDGIDIDGCNNVRISNCEIISGDDAIVLKSSFERPCRNITVTNCVISSNCSAFKLGTETNGGFENVTFSNSTIYNTHLAGITLQMVDGGTLTRVSVSNITMDDVGTAIFIRLGNRARPFKGNMVKPGMGSLSDVIISNIQASNVGITGCSITGLPGYPVKNITLENIRLTYRGGGTLDLVNREIPELPEVYPEYPMFGKLPSYGFYCRHAENITFNDIELGFTDSDARPAIVCDDINGLGFYRIKAMFSGNEPLMKLKDTKNVFIQSCVAPRGIETFLQISGVKSEHITVSGNDLSGAKNVIKKDGNIEVDLEADRHQ